VRRELEESLKESAGAEGREGITLWREELYKCSGGGLTVVVVVVVTDCSNQQLLLALKNNQPIHGLYQISSLGLFLVSDI